jgi:hypothetical protein
MTKESPQKLAENIFYLHADIRRAPRPPDPMGWACEMFITWLLRADPTPETKEARYSIEEFREVLMELHNKIWDFYKTRPIGWVNLSWWDLFRATTVGDVEAFLKEKYPHSKHNIAYAQTLWTMLRGFPWTTSLKEEQCED